MLRNILVVVQGENTCQPVMAFDNAESYVEQLQTNKGKNRIDFVATNQLNRVRKKTFVTIIEEK